MATASAPRPRERRPAPDASAPSGPMASRCAGAEHAGSLTTWQTISYPGSGYTRARGDWYEVPDSRDRNVVESLVVTGVLSTHPVTDYFMEATMSDPTSPHNIDADRCTVDGCHRAPHMRRWCAAHYQRWRMYGTPTGGGPMHRPRRPYGMSFEEAVDWEVAHAVPDGECLLSTQRPTTGGYARMRINGRAWRLPRAVLQRKLGRPILPREDTRHACHRPICINPAHLSVGSRLENMSDSVKAGRCPGGKVSGYAHGCSKLNPEQVAGIRQRYAADDVTMTRLGEEYGVNRHTISRVVRKESYPCDA